MISFEASDSSNLCEYFLVSSTIGLLNFHIGYLNIFCVIQSSHVVFYQDGNGYIDEQELDALLKDLCDKNKMVMNS